MTDAPRSPRVSFGLVAAEVMLRAKAGRLQRGDTHLLMLATLSYVGEHAALRDAVVEFVTGCQHNPVTAAAAFDDALTAWVETLPCTPPPTASGQSIFDWQLRADING